jgi:hypothetical protein
MSAFPVLGGRRVGGSVGVGPARVMGNTLYRQLAVHVIDFRHGACISVLLDDRQLAPKTKILRVNFSVEIFVFCHLGSW